MTIPAFIVSDLNRSLPVTLVEKVATAKVTYLYGLARIARLDSDDRVRYYHHDGLGSVRAITNTINTYADDVAALSPLGTWRLGEDTGTTAEDATANNRDGTYVSTPALAQTGPIVEDADTAVAFDGSNYVNVPSFTPLDGASAFSLATWVKTDAGTVEKYVLWRSGQLDLRIDTNSIAFSVKTGSTLTDVPAGAVL